MLRAVLFCFFLSSVCTAAESEQFIRFTKPLEGPVIKARAMTHQPWTVAGEHGALFGRQGGKFEAWQWPVKLLSNFSIRGELVDYPVPIDINALAAEIQVSPAETVITYSHAAFTVRQHMFAARGPAAPLAGAAIVFEIDSARPLQLVFSFTPDMLKMWPAPNAGRPNGEWVKDGNSGVYILHTDDPKFSAVVAMPGTQPGILVPYQEHPQTFPLELKLSFDPKRDRFREYPLIFALASEKAAVEQVAAITSQLPSLYEGTRTYYRQLLARNVTLESPDQRLNEALLWAQVAINQAQVDYDGETGMVAGYYESADSARPGYAWFFGRDTLWTTYAVNSYGDFALTRRALDFILRRQREDGKIMHEFSQSADTLDWKATPYFYAAADSAPLLVMAMADYVKTSGDLDYLRQHWDQVKKAYAFTRSHEAPNGIYNNTQGTGWVESWPQGMPYQEIYLASLDEQSARALAALAGLMGDAQLATQTAAKAKAIAEKIESGFHDRINNFYAFSLSESGAQDKTASIYPAVAWWDGTASLQSPGPMLTRWASTEFSTDWGTRDISNHTSFYDPISYHQGSIWPLFTGWVALAEYRAGRPLAGFAHLLHNANLTWAQDLGSVTELLSGDYFQPLGRSSSHQLWSSAMVISPLLRGLCGLEWDAPNHTLHVQPHLPATWDKAELQNVPLGAAHVDLAFKREGAAVVVTAKQRGTDAVCLQAHGSSSPCRPGQQTVRVPVPPVEMEVSPAPPDAGAATTQLRVTEESYSDRSAHFVLQGQEGQIYRVPFRSNVPTLKATGATVHGNTLEVQMRVGLGTKIQAVDFSW